MNNEQQSLTNELLNSTQKASKGSICCFLSCKLATYFGLLKVKAGFIGTTEVSAGEKMWNIGLEIVNREAKISEVGFMIKQTAQDRGFAGEALKSLKNYAYAEPDLNKLIATCSVNNVGSYKQLEKQGFFLRRLFTKKHFYQKTLC